MQVNQPEHVNLTQSSECEDAPVDKFYYKVVSNTLIKTPDRAERSMMQEVNDFFEEEILHKARFEEFEDITNAFDLIKDRLVHKINNLTFWESVVNFFARIFFNTGITIELERALTISQGLHNQIEVNDNKQRSEEAKLKAAQLLTVDDTNDEEMNEKQPQERTHPPEGIGGKWGFQAKASSSFQLFDDKDIIEKLAVEEKDEIGVNPNIFKLVTTETSRSWVQDDKPIYASRTQNKKNIIQQQASRGCTAAAAAMLIMDNGGKPDIAELINRHGGTPQQYINDFQKAGLTSIRTHAINLDDLSKLIKQYGSCVATLTRGLHHDLIVDEVSEKLSAVRIRDPYHGWEITVKKEAFSLMWTGGDIIQIHQK